MKISNYELIVLINGKPLREYYHDGNFFIEGRKKSEFSIRIVNHSGTKIKAITSVDGLSVIDGLPAGEKSQAYVVDPYSSIDIEGWRTSESTINKFVFSGKGKSYNAKMNEDTRNVGVIGLMVFQEVPKPVYRGTVTWSGSGLDADPLDGNMWVGGYVHTHSSSLPQNMWMNTKATCDSFDVSASSASRSFSHQPSNLGTGFGDEVASHATVDHTKFETQPAEIMSLYYDDREGLEKRGIVVDPSKSFPNPFPKYETTKFARRPVK